MFNHEDIILHWVNRLGILSRSELSHRFKLAGFSVSAEEWALLLHLWRNGAQTPSQLAALTFKDRTTVTRLVDSMVRKGFAMRREDPKDRRRSLVECSQSGVSLRDKLIPIAEEMIMALTAEINAGDLAVTLKTLKKMTQKMTTLAPPPNQKGTNHDRV